MRGAAFVVLVLGCAPAAASPRPTPPPTDADACPRLCEALARCGEPPPSCAASCEKERLGLRPEVHGGYVACVETELAICQGMDGPTRRQRVSVCFTAAIEVAHQTHGDAPLRSIATTLCARRARCDGTSDPGCVEALVSARKGSSGKLFAAVRPARLSAMAACVDQQPCETDDPVAACP